jgi:quercetin dioxygenase-like cupin family protein
MQDVRRTIRVISPTTAPKLNVYGAALSVLSSSNGAPVVIGEQTVPPGYGVPLQLHASDGESFYVLDGEFTLVSAEGETTARAGSFVGDTSRYYLSLLQRHG